ncbi:MAG: arylamine N-acetyltransferase [Planctomycetota bacterium]
MDVNAYLQRLELAGAPTTDRAGLARLQDRHLLQVPFENLDVRAGRPIPLDEDAAFAKIVTRRRGGFCFELNLAFSGLLRELGFEVSCLSAEVWNADAGAWAPGVPPGGHLALRVELEGRSWLVDVGFGPWPRQPIALDDPDERKIFGETFRLVDQDGMKVLQLYQREAMGFVPLYRFSPEPRDLEHFEEACRWQQSAPESKFVRNDFASLCIPDGAMWITPKALRIRRQGRVEEHAFTDGDEYRRTLLRYLKIDESLLPPVAG